MKSDELYNKYHSRSRRIGWSLSELCRRSRVSRATVTAWKLGKTDPRMGTIRRLEIMLTAVESALARAEGEIHREWR